MGIKHLILTLLSIATLIGCTREYDCADSLIQPAFIRFPLTDIDTFILRKFRPGDNYQNLIDTFIVKHGYTGIYKTSNDTTTVMVIDSKNGIKAGFDWQVYIPAKNKTVFISDIASEKRTGKQGYGIFSMDPGSPCINAIFSFKTDNQIVTFPTSSAPGSFSSSTGYYAFIRN